MISGALIFYGLVHNTPLGAFGSILGFLASFVTAISLWSSRTDDKMMWKWIHQGLATSPSVWLSLHMAHHACHILEDKYRWLGVAPMIFWMSLVW